MTPRYALQFGSRLHFKRCQALPKETPFPFFSGTPFFWTPFFLFFLFFLSPAKVGSLEMQPGAKLQAYLGVIILQPHACAQRFRLRILRRTRSNAGRTSARSLSGRIQAIWKTPSKERAAATRSASARVCQQHGGTCACRNTSGQQTFANVILKLKCQMPKRTSACPIKPPSLRQPLNSQPRKNSCCATNSGLAAETSENSPLGEIAGQNWKSEIFLQAP